MRKRVKHLNALLIGMGALLFVSACNKAPSTDHYSQSELIKGVNYIGISVSDLGAAEAFYSNSIEGLEVVERKVLEKTPVLDSLAGEDGLVVDSVMLRSSNAQLRLMQFAENDHTDVDAVPVNGPGMMHVCFQVDEKTRAYQKFLNNGAKTIGDPEMVQLNPLRPVKYAYVKDLDDTIVEIEHVDIKAAKLKEPPKHNHRMRHIALATGDVERLALFYQKLLEAKAPRRFDNISSKKIDRVAGIEGSKLTMAWFHIGNLELELAQYHSHPPQELTGARPIQAHGYNMIMLDVTDADAVSSLVVAAGGTIVSEKEMLDGGEVIFARDPDGNLLGLQEASPESIISSDNFLSNLM